MNPLDVLLFGLRVLGFSAAFAIVAVVAFCAILLVCGTEQEPHDD